MSTHLPADLEQFVQAKVRSGRFKSSDEAITAAVRLVRQQEEDEEARVVKGIQRGLEDMRARRGRPAEEVFADIRGKFNLPPDARPTTSSSSPRQSTRSGPLSAGKPKTVLRRLPRGGTTASSRKIALFRV